MTFLISATRRGGFLVFLAAIALSLPMAGRAVTLHVAESDRLSTKAGLHWQSSAPEIAKVFQNGCVIGLRPGAASITASDGGTYSITVTSAAEEVVDPATLKQFSDSREFSINGRKCFGSELNGQRAISGEEKRFTHSNRIINPRPLQPGKDLDWEVKPDAEIFDGAGILMGKAPPTLRVKGRMTPVSMFNFGASKVINGRICIYAFSVSIKPSAALQSLGAPAGSKINTSAWMPLDDVVDAEGLMDRDVLGKAKLPALPLEKTGLRVTGGNPRKYVTPTGELSIVHVIASDQKGSPPVPSHYLRRPSGTVNLVYSVPGFGLGGEGTDSFLVSDNLIFYPAMGAKVFKQPTYYPPKDPRAGEVAAPTMTFLYGAIKTRDSEPVYGWIAKEALAGN